MKAEQISVLSWVGLLLCACLTGCAVTLEPDPSRGMDSRTLPTDGSTLPRDSSGVEGASIDAGSGDTLEPSADGGVGDGGVGEAWVGDGQVPDGFKVIFDGQIEGRFGRDVGALDQPIPDANRVQ